MPININYNPAASLVGQAAYAGGAGDYRRYLSNLQLQQQQLVQQDRMQKRSLAVNEWQTQYGAASDQYMQRQGISNQQTMQLRDLTNQDYMQSQSLSNSRLMQLNDISNQQFLTSEQIAGRMQEQAYGAQAGQQTQLLSGNIQAALSAQGYTESLGLGSQNFDQQASLENLQSQNRMDINRSGIQDQLDYMPQLSEAQYSSQQQQFAKQFQSLTDAYNSGTINDDEFGGAKQQLLMSQLNLRSMMPATTDTAKSFAKNTFTDTNTMIPDGNGGTMPLRYLRNPATGEMQVDPFTNLAITQARHQAQTQQRVQQGVLNARLAQQELAANMAIKLMQGGDGTMTPQQAAAHARAILDGIL